MNSITITDMSGARPEHSVVITNFVSVIRPQLKNSTCFVFPDNVQYKWRLVMEVISPSTEKYDRGEKKDIYCQQKIIHFPHIHITFEDLFYEVEL